MSHLAPPVSVWFEARCACWSMMWPSMIRSGCSRQSQVSLPSAEMLLTFWFLHGQAWTLLLQLPWSIRRGPVLVGTTRVVAACSRLLSPRPSRYVLRQLYSSGWPTWPPHLCLKSPQTGLPPEASLLRYDQSGVCQAACSSCLCPSSSLTIGAGQCLWIQRRCL